MNVDDLDKLSKLIRYRCHQVERNLADEINSDLHDMEASKLEAKRILDDFGGWVASAANAIYSGKHRYATLIVDGNSRRLKVNDITEGSLTK